MFSIQTKSLELSLQVIPVGSLLLHEEILPNLAHELLLEFMNWTNLQNPIIVDENHIVLDGNHRAFAFRKLKFRHIPVCKIDYFHEKAELRYWFRRLSGVTGMDLVNKMIKEVGGHFRKVKDKETLNNLLCLNRYAWGIQRRDGYTVISFPEDLVDDAVEAYAFLEKIMKRLTGLEGECRFIPCQHVREDTFHATLKDDEMVIWTPQMTKEMVVDAAKKGKLFAPKSTRHCIPARPLNVNVPTTWFKEDLSLKEINLRFEAFLKAKKLRRFAPGQVIDGRYYSEEVFVFYDEK